jgi:iron complex outermembrane recepter protein
LNLIDEITFDPNQTPEDPFGTNRNLDPTIRRGFSISEKYQITEKISLGSQYNFVNAKFQHGSTAGKRIPLVSESNLHIGFDYAFREYWHVYTEAIYTGNQFAANDDANIESPIGGYTIFNSNLRFEYKHFTILFRMNNIFNKFYDFYSVLSPLTEVETFYPAPGRNVLLTLKYLFN